MDKFEAPYIEGEFQYFVDSKGRKWKRVFDFSGKGNHGNWHLDNTDE